MILVPLIGLTLLATAGQAFFLYPWHASCNIKWEVRGDCNTFKTRMINQIRAWEGDSLCPTTSATCPALPCGQNCLYSFTGESGNQFTGTHTTPVARYIDDLSFTLTDSTGGSCRVDARSNSRLWYAVLDMGTNYCNLRNLLDGSGYGEQVTEYTSDGVCTQYSSRDCTRF